MPGPEDRSDEPLQMLVTNLDHSDYVGRLAIGRIRAGRVLRGAEVVRLGSGGKTVKTRLTNLQVFEGLKRTEAEEAAAGEIVVLAGFQEVEIGDTIAEPDGASALPRLFVDEPTLSMEFRVNASPFAALDGGRVTSRELRARLEKELLTNVSLLVEPTDSADVFKVSGRGELHLGILIESMRREGYELAIGKPEVLTQEDERGILEPHERVVVLHRLSCRVGYRAAQCCQDHLVEANLNDLMAGSVQRSCNP